MTKRLQITTAPYKNWYFESPSSSTDVCYLIFYLPIDHFYSFTVFCRPIYKLTPSFLGRKSIRLLFLLALRFKKRLIVNALLSLNMYIFHCIYSYLEQTMPFTFSVQHVSKLLFCVVAFAQVFQNIHIYKYIHIRPLTLKSTQPIHWSDHKYFQKLPVISETT